MISVGDKVKRKVQIYDPDRGGHGGTAMKTPVDAIVEYIHPEARYFVLRYILPGGSYRETEYFAPRCGMAKN